MYALHDIIRSRVFAQFLHLPRKGNYSRDQQEILSNSWWVYSDYDIQSRISNQIRSLKRKLLQTGALNMPIYGFNRLISQSTLQLLISGFRKEMKMDNIIQFVKKERSSTIQSISKALNLQPKVVENSIAKAIKSWNIIKYQDKLYYWEEFLQDRNLLSHIHSDVTQLNEDSILTILNSYPFLTATQIALLSGYSKSQVEDQIYEIARNPDVSRGIMRKNSNEEYFSLNRENPIFDINWEDVPSFVLEKRDALVEILKLEKNIEFSEANYWFFIAGIPQAQFNMSRDAKSNHYSIKGFNRLLKTDLELSEIENRLKEWGQNLHMSLSIDFTDSPYAVLTKKMISSLEKRGYVFQNGSLSLQLDRKQSTSYNPFSMKKLGNWYLDKQMFGSMLSPSELLHELIQLDDLKSIIVRLQVDASSMDLTNVIYTAGINYRLGFIHKDMLPIIIRGWPKETRLNNIDQRIIELLENEILSTSQILAGINQPKNKILARIRYLEQIRMIHRDLSQGFNIQNQYWKILGMEPSNTNVKSLNDIGKILQQFLLTNPPLTINQISRMMGLSFSELTLIKQELLKSDNIIEGYFFDLYQDIQLSVTQVVNNIQEIMDSYKERSENEEVEISEIKLIPHSDPLTILHLSNLILGNKSLEIKNRIDPMSEIWMIMWNSAPSGYFLKIPSKKPLIDFDLDIRIVSDLVEIPVLSLIIEKMSYLNQLWDNDQLFLRMINNLSLSDRKFEQLHFILDTVGIRY